LGRFSLGGAIVNPKIDKCRSSRSKQPQPYPSSTSLPLPQNEMKVPQCIYVIYIMIERDLPVLMIVPNHDLKKEGILVQKVTKNLIWGISRISTPSY